MLHPTENYEFIMKDDLKNFEMFREIAIKNKKFISDNIYECP